MSVFSIQGIRDFISTAFRVKTVHNEVKEIESKKIRDLHLETQQIKRVTDYIKETGKTPPSRPNFGYDDKDK